MFTDIEIRDISLEDYIAVKGKYATFLPHTAGRYQKKRFRKATVSNDTVLRIPFESLSPADVDIERPC